VQLLERLNGGQCSAPIKNLVEEIAQVNRLDVIHRGGSDERWTRVSAETVEIVRVQKNIKKLLSSYPMTPTLRIGPDGWLHTFDSPSDIDHERKLDYWVLGLVHEACEIGLLARLARCEYSRCRKWFFQRVEEQKFHSAKCRERAFKSTPEWKAYRAKKARDYYRLHRDKNTK